MDANKLLEILNRVKDKSLPVCFDDPMEGFVDITGITLVAEEDLIGFSSDVIVLNSEVRKI